jgi:hypothetical protein
VKMRGTSMGGGIDYLLKTQNCKRTGCEMSVA